jgi:nucleoside-diphosphate-sugar epimerase
LVVLGCGFTGTVAARMARAQGHAVIATTRDAARAEALAHEGLTLHCVPVLTTAWVREHVPDGAWVLATYPPDRSADDAVTTALGDRHRCVYLSSTGVYGTRTGVIDVDTPVDGRDAKAAQRLVAEATWRSAGATVLRAAGIYGPWRGLHRRLIEGTLRVPADEHRVVSRIHVDDLAALSLAALASTAATRAVFPVGDDAPVAQRQVVRWLCARLGVAEPLPVSIDDAPETLRHDRSVDNRAVKACLGVALRYPTWREGFEQCLAVEEPQR